MSFLCTLTTLCVLGKHSWFLTSFSYFSQFPPNLPEGRTRSLFFFTPFFPFLTEWMNDWSETDCFRGVMGKPWTGNHEAWRINWRNHPASLASRFPWKGVRKSARWCSWLLSPPTFYGVLETPSSSISGGIDECHVVLTDPRCIPWHRKQLRACISIQRLSNHSMTHVKCQK